MNQLKIAMSRGVPKCSDVVLGKYRGTDKSLARPGRKQTTATEDFEVHISNLL